MSFGDLELHGHYDILSLVQVEVIPGRIQQPITNFTRPWDDFMVHDVNIPLVMGTYHCWTYINYMLFFQPNFNLVVATSTPYNVKVLFDLCHVVKSQQFAFIMYLTDFKFAAMNGEN